MRYHISKQVSHSCYVCTSLICTPYQGVSYCVFWYICSMYCFTLKIPTWICDYQLHHSALISLQGLLYHYYKVVLSLERDITLCLMSLVCREASRHQCDLILFLPGKRWNLKILATLYFSGTLLDLLVLQLMENSSRCCWTSKSSRSLALCSTKIETNDYSRDVQCRSLNGCSV